MPYYLLKVFGKSVVGYYMNKEEPMMQRTYECHMNMRQFDTGATRDSDANKPDYEGFLSPLVLEAYGRYMTKHRIQADGQIRDSDNWQKGIPVHVYMKSMWRHFIDIWREHRAGADLTILRNDVLEEALCALMFNTMGYLHEYLKPKR